MEETFVQCEGGHISEVMRPVNTKFCEFDGGDGGGRGVFESEGVPVCLCDYLAICCSLPMWGYTQSDQGSV